MGVEVSREQRGLNVKVSRGGTICEQCGLPCEVHRGGRGYHP
jgi:hypothetical protein